MNAQQPVRRRRGHHAQGVQVARNRSDRVAGSQVALEKRQKLVPVSRPPLQLAFAIEVDQTVESQLEQNPGGLDLEPVQLEAATVVLCLVQPHSIVEILGVNLHQLDEKPLGLFARAAQASSSKPSFRSVIAWSSSASARCSFTSRFAGSARINSRPSLTAFKYSSRAATSSFDELSAVGDLAVAGCQQVAGQHASPARPRSIHSARLFHLAEPDLRLLELAVEVIGTPEPEVGLQHGRPRLPLVWIDRGRLLDQQHDAQEMLDRLARYDRRSSKARRARCACAPGNPRSPGLAASLRRAGPRALATRSYCLRASSFRPTCRNRSPSFWCATARARSGADASAITATWSSPSIAVSSRPFRSERVAAVFPSRSCTPKTSSLSAFFVTLL